MSKATKSKDDKPFVLDIIDTTDNPKVALYWMIGAIEKSKMQEKRKVLAWARIVEGALNDASDSKPRTRLGQEDKTNLVENMKSELSELRALVTSKFDQLTNELAKNRVNTDALVESDRRKSYASVTKATAQSPPDQTTREQELVISLAGTASAGDLAQTPPATFKRRIETIIGSSSIEALRTAGIQGTRKSGKDKLIIRAQSAKDAATLKLHASSWIPLVFNGASLYKRAVQLIVHFVPTDFTPDNEEVIRTMCEANANVALTRDKVVNARWLRKSNTSPKAKSSIILTLNDPCVADDIIDRGICILGTPCNAEKLLPDPLQCFRCQGYGHQAQACPKRNADPSCARCAGNHSTGSMKCDRNCGSSLCSDIRRCTHIKFKCANCGGPHRSIDKRCPTRMAAVDNISKGPGHESPYFAKRSNHSGPRTYQ
jgi:hypothetical protein